jgi:hypothetical protein
MTKEQAIEEAWGEKYDEDDIINYYMFQNGFEYGSIWKENKFKAILEELLSKQKEVISSPIRFNGVSVSDIEEVFRNHGIEIKF